LRRVIQRRVDIELAVMVLGGSLNPGDKVIAGSEDGLPTLDVLEGAAGISDGTSKDEVAQGAGPGWSGFANGPVANRIRRA
jgi:hypothetical protein